MSAPTASCSKAAANGGVEIRYAVQPRLEGIAYEFLIDPTFDQPMCAYPEDNIFYGDGTVDMLGRISSRPDGAAVFAYRVENPERYGVVEFDSSMKPTIS